MEMLKHIIDFGYLYQQSGLDTAVYAGMALLGTGLFVIRMLLMFAFGHGCCDDPLYPWIARTLNDERITDPPARAKRLETKALTWLDHVLEYFNEGR